MSKVTTMMLVKVFKKKIYALEKNFFTVAIKFHPEELFPITAH